MSLRDSDPGVGISFALSFLVVGVAAVALHPARQTGPKPPPASTRSQTSAEPGPPAQPAETARPAVPVASRPEAAPKPAPHPARMASRAPASRPAVAARTVSRKRSVIRRPASDFTRVAEGESLGDVARRVYGSEEATDSLWVANRDLLDDRDAPLRPGATLRTP